MKTYVAQRLGIAVLTLFGMSVVIFVLLRLAPGDIVDVLFSAAGYVNPAEKKAILQELGLDKPYWVTIELAILSTIVSVLLGVPTGIVSAVRSLAGLSTPSFWLGMPHLVRFPGMAISLAVFGSNLFGDALRDTLDPRLRGA